ncbi:MAG: RDD family protein [Egibacteraceae bacterium]
MSTSDSGNWQPDGWDQPPPEREGGWQPQEGSSGQPGGWGSDAPRGPMPASVGKRIGAYIIDSILLLIVNAVLGAVIGVSAVGGFGDLQAGAEIDPIVQVTGALIGLFLSAAYFTLLEARNGQTLAKMMLSIRSVRMDGTAMDIPTAFRRTFWFYIGNVLGLIPGGALVGALSGLVGFGIILALLITTVTDKPNNRGLHDKFGDTMVIEG